MKGFHCLYSVLTIVLTGEWIASWLASNAGVLLLIVGVLVFWYLFARSAPPANAGEEHAQDPPQNSNAS